MLPNEEQQEKEERKQFEIHNPRFAATDLLFLLRSSNTEDMGLGQPRHKTQHFTNCLSELTTLEITEVGSK